MGLPNQIILIIVEQISDQSHVFLWPVENPNFLKILERTHTLAGDVANLLPAWGHLLPDQNQDFHWEAVFEKDWPKSKQTTSIQLNIISHTLCQINNKHLKKNI